MNKIVLYLVFSMTVLFVSELRRIHDLNYYEDKILETQQSINSGNSIYDDGMIKNVYTPLRDLNKFSLLENIIMILVLSLNFFIIKIMMKYTSMTKLRLLLFSTLITTALIFLFDFRNLFQSLHELELFKGFILVQLNGVISIAIINFVLIFSEKRLVQSLLFFLSLVFYFFLTNLRLFHFDSHDASMLSVLIFVTALLIVIDKKYLNKPNNAR